MIKMHLSIDEDSFRAEWAALEGDPLVKVAQMLELTGIETVAFLRSLTGNMQPPRNKGEGPRRAHPGGWADVTGNLANAYSFEVTAGGARLVWGPEGPTTGTEDQPVATVPRPVGIGVIPRKIIARDVTLWLRNTMDYAAALEAKDGYFVLSGVAEQGGPLDAALRKAARALGPLSTITLGGGAA